MPNLSSVSTGCKTGDHVWSEGVAAAAAGIQSVMDQNIHCMQDSWSLRKTRTKPRREEQQGVMVAQARKRWRRRRADGWCVTCEVRTGGREGKKTNGSCLFIPSLGKNVCGLVVWSPTLAKSGCVHPRGILWKATLRQMESKWRLAGGGSSTRFSTVN